MVVDGLVWTIGWAYKGAWYKLRHLGTAYEGRDTTDEGQRKLDRANNGVVH